MIGGSYYHRRHRQRQYLTINPVQPLTIEDQDEDTDELPAEPEPAPVWAERGQLWPRAAQDAPGTPQAPA